MIARHMVAVNVATENDSVNIHISIVFCAYVYVCVYTSRCACVCSVVILEAVNANMPRDV